MKPPLICQFLFRGFSLSVNFFLLFYFILDSCKGFALIRRCGGRQSCQDQRPVPGADALLNKASADNLARPRRVVQAVCTSAKIFQKLRICIRCVLLPKVLFLLRQGFLNHSSDRRFVNILSPGVCHHFFLS
ncbi:MAG: hypothetical protein E7444_04055 [Ruminococcaceae bacterium]|nr:hypothetical protein [Oscillospiraceae bacterium]